MRALVLLAALALAGCAREVVTVPVVTCPPVPALTPEHAAKVAEELLACGDRCTATKEMIGQHLRNIAIIEACRAHARPAQ